MFWAVAPKISFWVKNVLEVKIDIATKNVFKRKGFEVYLFFFIYIFESHCVIKVYLCFWNQHRILKFLNIQYDLFQGKNTSQKGQFVHFWDKTNFFNGSKYRKLLFLKYSDMSSCQSSLGPSREVAETQVSLPMLNS